MGVHRNIDANFLRGVMPKVPSKKHPYENFGMPYVFLWILQGGLSGIIAAADWQRRGWPWRPSAFRMASGRLGHRMNEA